MVANVEKLARDSVQDILDLTPLQEGLLFHYLKDPNSTQYHEQLCLTITGNLDQKLFQYAWEQVIQSNEMLRTVFRWHGLKKPVQIVLKQCAIEIAYTDFSHLEPQKQVPLIEEMKQLDRAQTFDLLKVAFRIRLCKCSAQQFLIMISNHHILYDGWSNGIILNEFFGNYQRLQDGKPLSASAKTPFKAYCQWLQSQDRQQHMHFWSAYLQGFHTQTTLPIASKQDMATRTSTSYKVACPIEIKQQLEAFCRANQVTLASLFYSAFGLVLQKYTNTNDVVFGTTVAGRTADIADMLHMVGLFINTLPLRVQAMQEQTALEVVQQVNEDLRARMGFEMTSLVDIKSASELQARDELFTVLMVIENYPLDQQLLSQKASLSITDFSLTEMTSYDLTVMVNLLFDSVEFVFTYVKERFDDAGIARLSDSFLTVCKTLIEDPSQRLSAIEIVSAREKARILSQFNTTARTYTDDTTLHSLFAEQVEKYAERPALIYAGEVLTYSQFDEKSSRLAAYLLTCGVESETIVGVCAERSFDLMVGIFAILKAGGAYLPLDPRLPAERIHYILEDSGAQFVLCQEKFQALLDGRSTALCLENTDLYKFPPGNYATTGRSENLAYVIYTSGSTGKPKGVLIEHRSVVNRLKWAQQFFHLDEEDVILQKTNIMFDVSLWELFGWLFSGAALCLLQPGAEADPQIMIETIARARVTTIHFVPSMFQLFLDYLQLHQASEQLQSLRRVLTSGEALHASQLAYFYALLPGIQLANLYGPTETTIDVSCYLCSPEDCGRENVPIGKPIDNIRLYVLNEGHTLQPIGVPGELFIAGVGVARGYINAPELTARQFVQDPFYPADRMYKSGDVARWTPDGHLEYLGRLDHQVKIRGFRVELQEIEAHLLQLPSIKEAIALVIKDTVGDDRLVACIVPYPNTTPERGAIKATLATKLPAFMVPDTYREFEHFPLTQTGKADRKKLLEMVHAGEKNKAMQISPELELNAIERVVAEIWADVLGVERVRLNDVFFEIGGNSLKVIRVCSRLMTALQIDLPVTAFFQYPTVRALAHHIAMQKQDELIEQHMPSGPLQEMPRGTSGSNVAVIGMAGRFPGAQNIDEFWENLCNGVEAISFLSDEELMASGIPAHVLEDPHYVRAKGILHGVEHFDAAFFGYSPKEAEVMDPQLRILHECVWEALENAGYIPETYAGAIGLYAGSSSNFHWLQKIAQRAVKHLDEFSLMLLNEKDFLSSRLAYKMNLKGPSVTIQTACSTSLAAIHYAYQALLQGQCDMAVAAGVSVTYPVKSGYVYEEGMVFSPDGHCRAFDAQAQGTVGGNGVGVVVLKRLEDALQQGDHIYAVIKGSAINNDGSRKVSFTAPGVDGQVQVITAAHAQAGMNAESITYIETHGTGTPLGDPIELEALTQAFKTRKQHFCAIGSVKTNIGHLDAAAGVASFVKTALALKHAQLPPSLHFEYPNPRSNLTQSPFYVVTQRSAWQTNGAPLRAGVSSFGMGGTNVHLVLEEPPESVQLTGSSDWQVIPFSAKTETASLKIKSRLRTYLQKHPELNLADVAYTLQVGRKPFAYRSCVVSSTIENTVQALDENEPPQEKEPTFLRSRLVYVEEDQRDVVFFFPGQGSQHINMGADLYKSFDLFKKEVDRCCDLLHTLFHLDIRTILYPEVSSIDDPDLMNQTEHTQPLLFMYEYALAQLLMNWGIRPTAMTGHSLGEYVAACLAGVFSLEDALKLVVSRARLMQKMPAGSMISVPMAEQELRQILPVHLSIAALNSKSSCVISGSITAIQAFARELKERGYEYRSLVTSHAFHSHMMEPILDDFRHIVAQVTFRQPCIPFISNVSGTWIQDDEATNPDYWVQHLRSTVRFSDGVEQLAAARSGIFVEVGPGKALTELVRKHFKQHDKTPIFNLCRHPLEPISDVLHLYQKLGELWSHGVKIDWERLQHSQRRRVPLPAYPFEAQRFWPDDPLNTPTLEPPTLTHAKQNDIADWFSVPSWERSLAPIYPSAEVSQSRWMVFALKNSFCEAFVRELQDLGAEVIVVYAGKQFIQVTDDEYVIHPQRAGDFKELLARTRGISGLPMIIVHLWNSADDVFSWDTLDSIMDAGFYALIHLVKALGELQYREGVQIVVLTSGIEQVTGLEKLCPGKATIYGFTKICPIEHPHIASRVVDFDAGEALQETQDELIKHLITECMLQTSEAIIAYRGGYRWHKVSRAARLEISPLLERRLRTDGIYLITGGLGGIGFALATFLARTIRPTLVLVGLTAFPEREAWPRWLETHGQEDKISRRIIDILGLEACGARVILYSADIADEDQVAQVVHTVEQTYGSITGVIHTAGVADYAGMLQTRSKEATAAILAPKVQGTLLLDRLLSHQALDFFVLCSSLDNVIYQQKFGQSGYSSANEFLDAYAYFRRKQGKVFWVSINWPDWQEVGMSVKAATYWAEKLAVDPKDILADGITNAEGIEIFRRILSGTSNQVIVSPQTLAERASKAVERLQSLLREPQQSSPQTQPAFLPAYAESSSNDLEHELSQIWQKHLGIASVGLDDNFFDLGADSFDLVQANSALQDRFQIEIPLVALYEHSTITSLARFIRVELLGEAEAPAPMPTRELDKAKSLLKRASMREKKK